MKNLKTKLMTVMVLLMMFITLQAFSQNITNTLGTNGFFYIKDPMNTFLTLKQTNGYLGLGINPTQQFELTKNFKLPMTVDSNGGIIYKGNYRFIHNFRAANTIGSNVFIGLNSGNYSMTYGGNMEYSSSYNVAVGDSSLNGNTTGSYNVALGSATLSKNTTGSVNTAVGHMSLKGNTTGINNIAVGTGSLFASTIGSDNVSLGTYSLFTNTEGNSNNAIGFDALYNNTTGSSNVAIGKNSIFQNTTGNNNTAVGNYSAINLVSGSNNTVIGNNAQPSTSTVSNQITLGNNQITSLRCNVQSITSLSDIRDKKDIEDLSVGLEFIKKLKPREFRWDKREWYENNVSDGSKKENKLNAGFIAQELDNAQINNNADWLDLVNKDNPDKIEATYGNLLPVMVKAIQELNDKNESLALENQKLKSEIITLNEVSSKLNKLEESFKLINAELKQLKSEDAELKTVSNK